MPQWSRRSFLIGAAVATASACSPGTRTRTGSRRNGQADLASLIETERDGIVRVMASDDIPAVAVCLIDDGQPVWLEGFGVTDRHSNQAVTTDTIFSIQSTSKHFTATAIMLAVQDGLLDLDAPITSYLPDFTVRSRFETAPQKAMTLRMLLGNRAGFTHEAPIGNNYDPEFPSFEAHVLSISHTWLRHPVGERYRYSNLGFDLAGYILQVRSGVPFADWLDAKLFRPLGMRDSTVATDVYAARTDRALGHDEDHTTVPLKTPLIPSGGVYTSARDIAAYCRFHLDQGRINGRSLLDEHLWHEMHAFPFGGDYSLGVIREELRHGDINLRLLSHAGGGFGFGSVFRYCPQAGLAWVALFNRPAARAYRFGETLIDERLTARFGAGRPRLPAVDLPTAALPAVSLPVYAGNYVGRGAHVDIEVLDGTLRMRQDAVITPLGFVTPDELYIAGPDGGAVTYRHVPSSALAPAHLECSIGEKSLDRNEGPDDVPGPDTPAWNRYVGTYRIIRWGQLAEQVTIRRKRGYLYVNDTRLITEFEPGLFFTCDGEAVDFRHGEPTWRNIRLQRV
jgi:CubicO group peptidase (beta-lactamase class C family)